MGGINLDSLFFAAAGSAVMVTGFWCALQGSKARGWPRVSGTITRSRSPGRLFPWSNDFGFFWSYVEYTYGVQGITYYSTRVMFGGPSWDQMKLKGAADRVAEEYGIGSSVTVHYDASKPQRAVLEPGIAFSSYMYLVIGGALLAIGAAGLLPR